MPNLFRHLINEESPHFSCLHRGVVKIISMDQQGQAGSLSSLKEIVQFLNEF